MTTVKLVHSEAPAATLTIDVFGPDFSKISEEECVDCALHVFESSFGMIDGAIRREGWTAFLSAKS